MHIKIKCLFSSNLFLLHPVYICVCTRMRSSRQPFVFILTEKQIYLRFSVCVCLFELLVYWQTNQIEVCFSSPYDLPQFKVVSFHFNIQNPNSKVILKLKFLKYDSIKMQFKSVTFHEITFIGILWTKWIRRKKINGILNIDIKMS